MFYILRAGGAFGSVYVNRMQVDPVNIVPVQEVRFDPEVVSFEDLVMLFFDIHDPTTVNQQVPRL